VFGKESAKSLQRPDHLAENWFVGCPSEPEPEWFFAEAALRDAPHDVFRGGLCTF